METVDIASSSFYLRVRDKQIKGLDMAVEFVLLDCNIFGSFKVGDNTCYNADVLCKLIEANADERFNKLIVLQIASILEAGSAQLFYRARHYNREGVPNISEEDRTTISEKQIDKLAVIIDNMRKYGILEGMEANIYEQLHKLRKYRNKIHIQGNVNIAHASVDEALLFNSEIVNWAIDLNWRILNHFEEHYARPVAIRGHVQPLRLPQFI